MKNVRDINCFEVDTGKLTPAEWQAYKAGVIQRAHEQRSAVLLGIFRALSTWEYEAIGKILAAFFDGLHRGILSRSTR